MSAGPHVVSIVPSGGNYAPVVRELLSLARLDGAVTRGESVLIKPNLHATQHWSTGGTVNPALVGALIEWARERGAARIMVADGPQAGHPHPEEVFTETGMAHAAEQHGAEWTVFPRHDYRLFRDASPHLPAELGISELLFAFDRIINVAVMKTHMDCLVTLAMKNLKGCIRSEDKTAFHQGRDIDRAIVELNRLIRADVNIVDGTLGMEGIGPAAGRPANFGHVFASAHAPSLDAVAASAMGVELEEARMLWLARDEGMLEAEGIEVVGEKLADIRRRFERPDEAMRRELPGLKLQSQGACSGCKLNVVRALRDNVEKGIPVPDPPMCIGCGEPPCADAVRIGRCQRRFSGEGPFLGGCPPHLDSVREFLAGLR